MPTNQAETTIWKEYQAGLDYQIKNGMQAEYPMCERFNAGDQWPPPTERTKTMPRPVINICNYVSRNKKANVLSQSIKMVFSAQELPMDDVTGDAVERATRQADNFTSFSEKLWYDVDQEHLNDLAVADASIYGPGIWHYFFDPSINGGTYTKYSGALAGENIDPLCCFVGNPENWNIQQQPYILLASREDTELLKEKMRAKKDATGKPMVPKSIIDSIRDDSDTDIERYDKEQNRDTARGKTTLLTKYFRKDGIVYMQQATKAVDLFAPTPLNGNRRYPVEIYNWKDRKRSIYGVGETQELISPQKSINFIYGLMLLCVQNMASPKVLLMPGALEGQTITAEVGQILTNMLGDPNAIKYLDPPQFSNATFAVVDNLIGTLRTMTGVTQTLTGEQVRSDMAVGAIIAIQNQAKQPIVDHQKRLYRSIRNIGRIQEEFIKNYYTLPRAFTIKNDIGQPITQKFVGSEFQNVGLDLKVNVGPGSSFDEALSVSMLEKGYLQKDVTFEEMLEYMPDNAVPFRADFMRKRKLQAQNAEMITEMVTAGDLAPQALMVMGNEGILPQKMVEQILASLPPPPEQQPEGGEATPAPTE
jgi:hypothetical protein